MPNPHFDVKIISRSAGQSAVASAAYRSGEVLHDERIGKTFDYTYRRENDLQHSEIMAAEDAPDWVGDRGQLWGRVETAEKRKDAQLARDFIAGLPRELTLEQNVALAREFISDNFISKGMVADFSIHESEAGDGGRNPHVHIMLTMRELDGDGFASKKTRAWNDHANVPAWRQSWEDITNRHLEESGCADRLSMASYEARDIPHISEIHLGYQANGLERKGRETNVGTFNREAKHQNSVTDLMGLYAEPAPVLGMQVEPEGTASAHQLSEADRQHDLALGDYLRVTMRRTATATAEMFNRVGEYFSNAWEDARSIIDRYADMWQERDEPHDDLERELER